MRLIAPKGRCVGCGAPNQDEEEVESLCSTEVGSQGEKRREKGHRPEASFNLNLSLRDKTWEGSLELS